MIGIMGLLIVNKVIFLHIHILDNGTIIEHAHPYNKSKDREPFKSHHHSDAQFLIFEQLKILFLSIFATPALIAFMKAEKFFFECISDDTVACIILHQGRAPPFS